MIFWGSQSGTAQAFAARLAKDIKRRFQKTALVADFSDYDPSSIVGIPNAKPACFIMSTFGEGDPSDNVHQFYGWLAFQTGTPLSNLQYLAFGLGNSNYKRFNAVVDFVVKQINSLGAHAILPTAYADDRVGETEDHFLNWKEVALATLKSQLLWEDHAVAYEPSIRIEDAAKDTTADAQYEPITYKHSSRAAARDLSPIFPLDVLASHELFKVTGDRNCLHLEIDLSTASSLKYKTGDHLAIWPSNPNEEVLHLVKYLGWSARLGSPIRIVSLDAKESLKVPEMTTLAALLHRHLEICAPVSRDTISSLVAFAPNETAKHRLTALSKDATVFRRLTQARYMNFGRLLQYACDQERAWSTVPLSFLIEVLPAMRPRYYSISSSSIVQPRQAAITAVVADKALAEPTHVVPGLTTNYLLGINRTKTHVLTQTPQLLRCTDGFQDLKPGKVYAHIRKSRFKLPAVPSRPIIMVGAGTGVAPFRAFLQERAALLKMGHDVGHTVLFFGCRNEKQDYIYQEEFRELATSLGDRCSVIIAFSRPDTGDKAYVQDKIREHAGEVCKLLTQADAHFYICGSASMAREVSNTVDIELKERQGWDEDELRAFAHAKKVSNKWMQDVWG